MITTSTTRVAVRFRILCQDAYDALAVLRVLEKAGADVHIHPRGPDTVVNVCEQVSGEAWPYQFIPYPDARALVLDALGFDLDGLNAPPMEF